MQYPGLASTKTPAPNREVIFDPLLRHSNHKLRHTVAQFIKLCHNDVIDNNNTPLMTTINDLLKTIQSAHGISLAKLLAKHPDLARRTAQRWIYQLLNDGAIDASGKGRARRYWANRPLFVEDSANTEDRYPAFMPLSADSKDILTYIDLPLAQRKPVGYQREFLETYEPNKTTYLSASLRHQLAQMGNTHQKNLPVGTYGRDILHRLLIDLSWASSHLEGNTYSRWDTRKLIEHGKAASGKDAIETQMILNHKAAIEWLVENIDQVGFNRFTLFNLHSALAENLLDDNLDEGRIREHDVGIGQSVFRPLSVVAALDDMLDMLLSKAGQIEDPFEQSFFVMIHLPYLQPFADINKRTSRLMANLPLLRANLCPLTFLGVPERAYSRAILGVYELLNLSFCSQKIYFLCEFTNLFF